MAKANGNGRNRTVVAVVGVVVTITVAAGAIVGTWSDNRTEIATKTTAIEKDVKANCEKIGENRKALADHKDACDDEFDGLTEKIQVVDDRVRGLQVDMKELVTMQKVLIERSNP